MCTVFNLNLSTHLFVAAGSRAEYGELRTARFGFGLLARDEEGLQERLQVLPFLHRPGTSLQHRLQ